MYRTCKQEDLYELGKIHGMQGKRLQNRYFAHMSAHDVAAYHDGIYDGHVKVCEDPTVDMQHFSQDRKLIAA